MKQLYLPLLINFLFIQHGRGKGTMSIKLIHFNNPGGEDNNGNYCDRSVLKWQSACDHYFYLCLDKVNGSKTNIKQCDVATRQTKTVDDKNQIDFTDSIGGTPNPIEIPINKWEGGLLLKVKVWDEDPGLDDSVELLSTIVRMNASKSKEEIIWHPYQLKRRTQLDLEIAVFCDDDSYPPHCTHCKASNDNNGHYYCDSEGGKHCQPGWAGKDCKINKDECESQPCQSGGTCLDQIGEYTCTCKPGYTGIHCETEILSRTATTPQNNTTGINNEGQHSDCPSGYGGSDCETKESTETNVQPTGTSKLFAIIPVILLVVVIAVLVIIWKRRQQRLKEESDPPTERRSDQNGTELYNMAAPVNQGAVGANDQLTDEVTYDEINDCNRQTADDYAVEIYDNSVYGGNQQATYATPQIDDNAVEIYDNSVYGTNQQATYSTPQTDDNAVEMYDNSVYGANQQATYSVPQKDNHKGATARDRSDSVTSEVLIQENEIYN